MSDATPPSVRLRGLLASAMIGTDRAGSGTAGTENVLTQSAMLGMQVRAGWRPSTVSARFSLCPADTRLVAPPAASATLQHLMANPDGDLIEEWAELANARRLRVEDATVPVVLDWWSRQPHRSEAVFAVLGARGEWLASLNAAWRKPVAGSHVPTNVDDIWQTGTTPDRMALLLTVRRHDPGRALLLIQSTWATDGAEERRRFLEALIEKAWMADEPFLEAALGDKSKVVRRQAARVLGQLLGSRLRARMTERARTIIGVESKRSLVRRVTRIGLAPPKEFVKEWERDGIEEKAASAEGPRAWWMQQILSVTDLALWTELSGMDPAGVVAAIRGDDFAKPAMTALVEAARAEKNSAWAIAITRELLARKDEDSPDLEWVWPILAPAERETFLIEVISLDRYKPIARWEVAASSDHKWSADLSMKVLKLLKQRAPKKPEDVWALSHAIARISRCVCPNPASVADAFEEAVSALFTDATPDSFKKSIDRVRLRADMHKEFSL